MMETVNRDDKALIDSLKEGNYNAINEFYKIHKTEFIKWSNKKFGLERTKAPDIYHDSFLILYKNIILGKVININSSLKTYLFGIAKNLILENFKKENKAYNQQKSIRVDFYDGGLTEPDLDMPNNTDSIIDSVISSMDKLSEKCQHMLRLYYFEKKSMKEIAEKLGYNNEDVVKSQKVRCLKYLKSLVSGTINKEDRTN